MTTKQNETTEAQPETRAELEKTLAKLEALDRAENEKKQAAETQRIAAIHARKARLDELRSMWGAMAAAAAPWNIIHELAGKYIDDPRFMLGLICFAMVNPMRQDTNENTWRSQLRAYIEGRELGIDPAKPELGELPEWVTLQAEHVAHEQAEEAKRLANR